MIRYRRYLLLSLMHLYITVQAQIDLVKDLNPAYTGIGSFPTRGMAVGDWYFFAATDTNGMELWKTKATSSSTKLVKDITAGTKSSFIRFTGQVNGILVFTVAFDDHASGDFWLSDGTETGTIPLNYSESYAGNWPILYNSRFYFEAFGKSPLQPHRYLLSSDGTVAGTLPLLYANLDTVKCPCLNSIILDNKLYFTAYSDLYGEELFVTDGTAAGTQLVKDIKSGTSGSEPFGFALAGGKIFFSAKAAGGRELWVSDGTEIGTFRVKDINPDGASNPTDLTPFDGQLFFVAREGENNSAELWKSDGTEAGTVRVKDIVPGPEGSDPHIFNATGNKLFFAAKAPGSGTELWMSDGTESGTQLTKDLNPGSGSTVFYDEDFVFAGKMVFTAYTGESGKELFVSDGTTGGTKILKDIFPGPASSSPSGFLQLNATMFFAAEDPVKGIELYQTNGSSSGTKLLKDIDLSGSSSPESFGVLGDVVLFAADNGADGKELWKSNGKANGTKQVADINEAANYFSSDPAYFTVYNDAVFFLAHGNQQNMQLWKTDGTFLNTQLIYDFGTNTATNMAPMAVAGASLYLIGDDKELNIGAELWKSDGTTAGTQVVADIAPGPPGSAIKYLYAFNDEVFFSATASGGGNELYKSNGTAAGTVLLYSLPGDDGFYPSKFKAIGEYLFFSAANPATDYELWRTDGTTAGTILVKNINTNTSATPGEITAIPFMPGKMIFSAYGPDREPYISDGTSAGTFELEDIGSGSNSSYPGRYTACDGTIYFFADYDTDNSGSLWKTDGTTSGTIKVADVDPNLLTCLNNTLYFVSLSDINESIWKSDGTETGTVDVLDIGPAPISGNQYNSMIAIGDRLYFNADSKLEGEELYQSDGTQAGTFIVEDVNPGKENFNPENIILFNGKILMSGMHPSTGNELWAFEPVLRTNGESEKETTAGKIIAFPNPFSDFVQLNLSEIISRDQPVELSIADLSGKVVFHGTFDHPMNIQAGSELPSGCYLIEIHASHLHEIVLVVKE